MGGSASLDRRGHLVFVLVFYPCLGGKPKPVTYWTSPSICTISASPSPTAANTDLPSDDHEILRAMNVRFCPKSVTRRNFPSAVPATQMFVPTLSSRGITSDLPSGEITG